MNSVRQISVASASVLALALSGTAFAQDAGANYGLEEIIVTAQKREQSLLDVPVAVTAIGGESLEANRVSNILDLSGLAPGLTVTESAGASKTPGVAMRGALGYGVTPGSDRQVGVYVDGVYMAAPRGAIFDLPDTTSIEILRGPQGTLFGRNSTSGAISVKTRDPDGRAGIIASGTIGNQDHYRFRLTASTPDIGPFSAYFSYVREQRDGDIRNLGAGQRWDRTASLLPRQAKITRSPEYLGGKDANSWFAAVKFEAGDFKTVYKYDREEEQAAGQATAPIYIMPFPGNPFAANAAAAGVTPVGSTRVRPEAVFNSYAVPVDQTAQGHTLTSTYELSDSVTIENIFSMRSSYMFGTNSLDGLGAPQVAPGVPVALVVAGSQSRSKQWSDELQINYTSDVLTATFGALWFESKDWVNEGLLANSVRGAVPGGVIDNSNVGRSFNEAQSIAGYAQLDIHATDRIDVVLGGRVTQDKKNGEFLYGPDGLDPSTLQLATFDYKDTKFNYLIGVNFKPTDDMLLYVKWSTAYVSGGGVPSIEFDPETVKSAELGFKGEFLDRKLRTNLAVYWAEYKHVQSAQSPLTLTPPEGDPALYPYLSTYNLDTGTRKAKGFEFDFSAAPVRGITLGGGLSYTHIKFSDINPGLLAQTNGQFTGRSNIPAWQGSLYAQYESEPLFDEAYLTLRADGIWTGDTDLVSNPDTDPLFVGNDFAVRPAYWTVNARAALTDIDLGGVKTELAAWGRNLFDVERLNYGLDLQAMYAGNFNAARSYGVDVTIKF